MVYIAEKGDSKAGIHPVLIYRLAADEKLCYKFRLKRTNTDSFAYVCLGCEDDAKLGSSGSITSVRVKADYTEFLSDPEAIGHLCKPFEYLAVDAQQKYR